MSNKRQLDRAGLDDLLAEAGVGPAASSGPILTKLPNICLILSIGRPTSPECAAIEVWHWANSGSCWSGTPGRV
jgi:hypothetical protein